MTNHVHLLLTPRALDSCARLMKALGQLHTQYMNRTYGRSGSLWEGRFRSSLVQSERYLLECYRYVELNPVEARIVEHPGDYAWSSYAANVGAARSALVTPHDEYLRLGRSDEARTHAYRALFDVPLAPERIREIRAATDGNFALGDDNFKRGVSLALGRRAYPGVPGRPSCAAAVDGNQDDLFEERKNVVCP